MEKWSDGHFTVSSGNQVLHVIFQEMTHHQISRNALAFMIKKQGHRPGKWTNDQEKNAGLLFFVSHHKCLLLRWAAHVDIRGEDLSTSLVSPLMG